MTTLQAPLPPSRRQLQLNVQGMLRMINVRKELGATREELHNDVLVVTETKDAFRNLITGIMYHFPTLAPLSLLCFVLSGLSWGSLVLTLGLLTLTLPPITDPKPTSPSTKTKLIRPFLEHFTLYSYLSTRRVRDPPGCCPGG